MTRSKGSPLRKLGGEPSAFLGTMKGCPPLSLSSTIKPISSVPKDRSFDKMTGPEVTQQPTTELYQKGIFLLTQRAIVNFPRFRWDGFAVALLLGLGFIHLPINMVSDLAWDHPSSFRKPILFGISTGLTLGSLLLLLNDLHSRRWDRFLRGGLCVSLVLEVVLITIQAWRGVPSHFNRSTFLDALIETLMLICILLAVAVIVGLTARALRQDAFRTGSPARILAHRAGMLFLVASCFLGIGITIVGNYQLLQGGSTEIFGNRGVMKFPHGAVLHAIQTLVIWSWLCDKFASRHGQASVAWLVASHFLFILYATRQTLMGHSRWETDELGWGLLGSSVACVLLTVLAAIWPRK